MVQTFEREPNELVHLKVNGEEITTTSEHPFYVPKKGWTDAIDLKAGDILVLVNGEMVTVEMVQHEIVESPVKVYNFEVEDFHTYYVGTSGILVHNANCSYNSNQQATIKTIKANGKSKPLSMSDANKLVERGKKNGLNVHIDIGHPEKIGVSKGPHLHTGFNNWHIPIKK